MKVVLSIVCWIFAILCCCFPFLYTHSTADKMEVKVSHILVNTQDEAVNLRKEITDGKSFEKAAEQYSQCPSKMQKGDIGYNRRGELLAEFEAAAFDLPLNALSEPVQTSEGWHLIKVYGIKYFSDKENFSRRYF